MQATYISQTYHPLKVFGCAFPVFIAVVALVIWMARLFNSTSLLLIGWVAACVLPFLFQARIKRLFMRKAILSCDDQLLSIVESSLKNATTVQEFAVKWRDIVAYKFYFSGSNSTYLTLYLRQGPSKSYCFQDKKIAEDAMGKDSIFGVFRSCVKQYNAEQSLERQIVLKPGFLVTRPGAFLLYGITVLAVYTIVVCYRARSKEAVGLLLMSISIIIGLWGKKQGDQALYNKLHCYKSV